MQVPWRIDADGQVTFGDFLVRSANFDNEVQAGELGDIDGDGKVGFGDFLVLSENFGETFKGTWTTKMSIAARWEAASTFGPNLSSSVHLDKRRLCNVSAEVCTSWRFLANNGEIPDGKDFGIRLALDQGQRKPEQSIKRSMKRCAKLSR